MQSNQGKLREGREAAMRADAATQQVSRLEAQVQGLQASRNTLHTLVTTLKASQDELRAVQSKLSQVTTLLHIGYVVATSHTAISLTSLPHLDVINQAGFGSPPPCGSHFTTTDWLSLQRCAQLSSHMEASAEAVRRGEALLIKQGAALASQESAIAAKTEALRALKQERDEMAIR